MKPDTTRDEWLEQLATQLVTKITTTIAARGYAMPCNGAQNTLSIPESIVVFKSAAPLCPKFRNGLCTYSAVYNEETGKSAHVPCKNDYRNK
jgi:hypothetical protein